MSKPTKKTTTPASAKPPAEPPAPHPGLGRGWSRRELEMQAAETLWLDERISKARKEDRMAVVIAMMQALAPGDDVDVVLAAQMVACHHAAMDCLRRATWEWRTREGRDMELRNAARLMNLYARQTETLDRRRGARPGHHVGGAGQRGRRRSSGGGACRDGWADGVRQARPCRRAVHGRIR